MERSGISALCKLQENTLSYTLSLTWLTRGSSWNAWNLIALQQMDSVMQSQLYPNSDLANLGNS